jgi:ketosteroid isomerase-like protein
MPIDDDDRKVVEDLYKAMQAGPAGESAIMDLFADDAVLVEPFTGQPRTHSGKPAIRAALTTMWQGRAPDLVLTLDRIDMEGDSVRAEWTCTSAVLPGPLRGRDCLTVRSGKVVFLEIAITEMPQSGR